MNKSLAKMIDRYNNLIWKAELLRSKIDDELFTKYDISECYLAYGRDEFLDIHQSCSDEFDPENIDKAIKCVTEYRKITGENPKYQGLKKVYEMLYEERKL